MSDVPIVTHVAKAPHGTRTGKMSKDARWRWFVLAGTMVWLGMVPARSGAD